MKGQFMDLHDYEEVAENYDLYFDAMYKNEDNHSGWKQHRTERQGYFK